jgi:1-acyl-sn-glycerol-3-phosphate acyltransferase
MLPDNKLNWRIILRLTIAWTFWTIVFFPVIFLPRRFHYKFLWGIFTSLFLWANKIRVNYCSEIDLNNQERPMIFASNHKGYFDAYVIISLLKHPFSIVYNQGMDRNFFYKLMARKMGLVPIRRDIHYSQKNSFDKIRRLLKNKYSIIIFPEGFHIIDKEIAEFKRGIAKIAADTGAPVMPIAIYGFDDRIRYDKSFRLRDIYIKSSQPIRYSDYENESSFLSDLRSRVVKLYNELELEFNVLKQNQNKEVI